MLFRYELLGLAYFPNRLSVLAEMQVLRAWFKYAESSPLFLAKGLEGMMNEEIKSNLKKLFDCKEDFTVTQTGKKSNKVNGLYKPATHEIFLHNLNFNTSNELMYTAVHEFTHHYLTTEKGDKGGRHNGLFWATFYDLLEKAISYGFYERTRSEETQKLIDEAKEIQKAIIDAQRKLGETLSKIYESYDRNNERIEDVIEHDLQITRNKSKEYLKMRNSDTNSDEMAKVINSAKDVMIKAAAQKAADEGKTVEQVKQIAKAKPVDDDLESPESLRREEKRLETTIERLNDRLIQVQETLRSMTGGD